MALPMNIVSRVTTGSLSMNISLRVASRTCKSMPHIHYGAPRLCLSKLLAPFSSRSSPMYKLQSSSFFTCPHLLNRQKERDLAKLEVLQYFKEEIRNEKESQVFNGTVPSVPGFDMGIKGSLVTLTQESLRERVRVTFDVLNTLQEDESLEEAKEEEDVASKLTSKPSFQVDISRGDMTLTFRCSFLDSVIENQNEEDAFCIEQFFIDNGQVRPSEYVALTAMTNPEFYDRLLVLLEERGINTDFAVRVSDVATAVEHQAYIRTLRDILQFVTPPSPP